MSAGCATSRTERTAATEAEPTAEIASTAPPAEVVEPAPRVDPPAEALPEPVAPAPGPGDAPAPSASPPVPGRPAPGQASILVESAPPGAVVVLDGRPVGPTPARVLVPATERGYLSRPVSIKVRFLANGALTESQTTELVLTQLDRVPVRLDFTPSGAKRTFASFR